MVRANNYKTTTFVEVMQKKSCGLFFPDTVYYENSWRLSIELKTDICGYLMLENFIGHLSRTRMYAALSELCLRRYDSLQLF